MLTKLTKTKNKTHKKKQLTQQIIRPVPAQGFRPIYYNYPFQKHGRVKAGQQSFAEI